MIASNMVACETYFFIQRVNTIMVCLFIKQIRVRQG